MKESRQGKVGEEESAMRSILSSKSKGNQIAKINSENQPKVSSQSLGSCKDDQ